MTAQLSRERLDYLKERLPTRIKSLEIHEKNGSIGSSQQETLDAFRLALAGMESDKNSRIAEALESLMWPNMAIGNKAAIKAAIDALRAAPPAPVAVPECFRNAVSALESLYRNGQKQCWNERYTTDMSYASGVLNACRAAMLKAGPVTGWIKCSERMPDNKEGLWSKEVIALSDLGEPFKLSAMGGYWQRTQAFIDSGASFIVCWMPLPAAPEQEV